MAAIVDLNYLIQLAEFSFENTKLELRSGFVVGEQMQKKQRLQLLLNLCKRPDFATTQRVGVLCL